MRIAIYALAALLAVATQAAEMVVQVKTIAPLQVPAGKEARSVFDGLKPDALQLGMGEAILIGATTYEVLPDKTTRTTVNWHSLGLSSSAATQPLRSPLVSQFRVGGETVNPATVISARGDFDALAEDFGKLKAQLQKGTPRDVVKQTNNNNTETTTNKNAADALQPSGSSGGGFSPGSAPYSFNNQNDKIKTDLITTQWQNCVPRIDTAGKKVYAQARRIDITESGRVMSTGNCEDHGTIADIVREYDKTCTPVVDVANRKVYHQFREFANLDGKTVDVSLCTADFAKFAPILSDLNGCSYRHDFIAGQSVRQEKLYYNDPAGAIVPVRDCGDSTSAFKHFITQNTCTPTIDNVNKQVFFNIRTAFTDDNGVEQYANDCRPDGAPGIAISEEFCSPKYEHDFINNVSYYSTKPYYTDATGKVVYLAACSRSAQASFPHTKTTSGCNARNDDTNLKTYFSEKKTISTTQDGVIEVQPCTESQTAQSYAYIGNVQGGEYLARSDGSTTHASVAARLPTVDFSNPFMTVSFSSGCTGVYSGYWYQAGFHNAYISSGTWDAPNMNGSASSSQAFSPIGNQPDLIPYWNNPAYIGSGFPATVGLFRTDTVRRYMRGDSSYYDILNSVAVKVRLSCNGGYQ